MDFIVVNDKLHSVNSYLPMCILAIYNLGGDLKTQHSSNTQYKLFFLDCCGTLASKKYLKARDSLFSKK